ncbi:MAG: hypothetical protein ACOYZ8_11630 [Chloroflexota bacterium]
MKIITPPKPRHTSEVNNEEITITIPVKKRWAEIVWFLFFLFFVSPPFYWLGRAVLLYLLSLVGLYGDIPNNTDSTVNAPLTIGALVIIVLGLLIVELWMVYSVLWRLAGKEIITANKDVFMTTRKLFGWKRYRAYKTSDISALRISRPTDYRSELFSEFRRMFGGAGTIAFDYGAKSFRLGEGLDEAEGRQIIKKLQSHLSNFLPQLALDGKVIGEYN